MMYVPIGNYPNSASESTASLPLGQPSSTVVSATSVPNPYSRPGPPFNHQSINYSPSSSTMGSSAQVPVSSTTPQYSTTSTNPATATGVVSSSIAVPYASSSSPTSSQIYNHPQNIDTLQRYHNIGTTNRPLINNVASAPASNSLPPNVPNLVGTLPGSKIYNSIESNQPHIQYQHPNNHFSTGLPSIKQEKIDLPHLNLIHPPLHPHHPVVQQHQNHLIPPLLSPQLPSLSVPLHPPSIPAISPTEEISPPAETKTPVPVVRENPTPISQPIPQPPSQPQSQTPSQPQVIMSNDRKRRGRPKKLIFDSSLNEYIDSSHPNFKQLNKELKNLERIQMSTQNSDADESFESEASGNNDSIAKLHHQPTYLRKLDDDAVKQLMQKKDRRGRPRKFPVEQTGLTIKGIRVNGNRKKKGE